MIPNQPMSSHIPITSIAYTVPMDHFTTKTSNVVMVSDLLLVGTHTIIPFQLTSSTIVPQVTPISIKSSLRTQDPIGKPFLLRSNPSLTPRYNTLNSYIANPS